MVRNPGGAPFQGTDKQLLDEIQKGSFQFFWNETNPQTGQVKDRAFLNGKDTRKLASICATGFGLTSLRIGDARGYAAHGEILERVRVTLAIPGESNAHGSRLLLALRGYGQPAAVGKVRAFFDRYFPAAMRNFDGARVFSGGGPTFSMGWMPDSGFLGKVRRPKIRCRDEKNERTETSVKEKLPTSWGEWRLVGSFLWA